MWLINSIFMNKANPNQIIMCSYCHRCRNWQNMCLIRSKAFHQTSFSPHKPNYKSSFINIGNALCYTKPTALGNPLYLLNFGGNPTRRLYGEQYENTKGIETRCNRRCDAHFCSINSANSHVPHANTHRTWQTSISGRQKEQYNSVNGEVAMASKRTH